MEPKIKGHDPKVGFDKELGLSEQAIYECQSSWSDWQEYIPIRLPSYFWVGVSGFLKPLYFIMLKMFKY